MPGKCLGDRVAGKRACEEAVDDVLLVGDPEVCELHARACRFPQGRALGPAHEHDCRAGGIAERGHGRVVHRTLRFEPRERTQTARAGRVRLDVLAPSRGQAQQAERMTRRCSVEQHMVELRRRLRIRDQHAERVERRDLHGALPRPAAPRRPATRRPVRGHATARAPENGTRRPRPPDRDSSPTGPRRPESPKAEHRAAPRRRPPGSRRGRCSPRGHAHRCRPAQPRPPQ